MPGLSSEGAAQTIDLASPDAHQRAGHLDVSRLSDRSISARGRVSSRSLIWITVIERHPERLDDVLSLYISIGTGVTSLSVIYTALPQNAHIWKVGKPQNGLYGS